LCELGRNGQKTAAGWYRYDAQRNRLDDPESERIVRQLAADAGIEQREIDAAEMVDRTVYALVNEGARILEEGYALRAADIDIIYLNGYGFPAYRGGPMWHADTVGLAQVLSRIREFHEQHGYWWQPAPLLEQLAAEGKTFAAWDRQRQPAA
jgi:3-hydroxyacyl-CoA dehydrogenase